MTETGDSTADVKHIQDALSEIRREGLKASFIHGVVDSAILLLGLTFGLSVANPGFLPDRISFEVANPVAENVVRFSVSGSVMLAIGVTFVFFVVDVALVYRRRSIEFFEELNPEVREALRTARDVSEKGEENEMARRLYDDVIESLRDTSSAGFVSGRRMLLSLFLMLALGLLLMYASYLGPSFGIGDGGLFGGGGTGGDSSGAGSAGSKKQVEYQGLQSPNEVLGKKAKVSSGSDEIDVGLKESGGSGEGGGGSGGYGQGQLSDEPIGNVESARSGYSSGDRIEDSELVKEYNLKIRQQG